MRYAALFAAALLAAAPVAAHDGPAFPLTVDRAVGPYRLSVWADPDVGVGTFYVQVTPTPARIQVAARPVTRRLPEARFEATRAAGKGDGWYVAQVPFDQAEFWEMRFLVDGPTGEGAFEARVEATPPGVGPWGIALFLGPFLLIGALWLRGAARYRRG